MSGCIIYMVDKTKLYSCPLPGEVIHNHPPSSAIRKFVGLRKQKKHSSR